MNNLNNGESHKIFFSKGQLFLDGKKIAGEGIVPEKDILFEFKTNLPAKVERNPLKDPSILEVNVCDAIKSKDLGPGQTN